MSENVLSKRNLNGNLKVSSPVLVLLLCSELQTEPPLSPSCCSSSYLLVILHIVAQTDQTGLELLGHQGPAVVLRSVKDPLMEDEQIRMRVMAGDRDINSMQRYRLVEDGGTDKQTIQDVQSMRNSQQMHEPLLILHEI